MKAEDVAKAIRAAADPGKAAFLQGFFRTGEGEYGAGDLMLGVTVPQQRCVAKHFSGLPLGEVQRLLRSQWHEERSVALMILVLRYQRGDAALRERLHRFYLRNTRWVNN
jgi:hypothetical protein